MKNIFTLLALCSITLIQAQSYTGKGDKKVQVGANFQDNATSIFASFDYGLGENISAGVSSTYALGIDGSIDKAFAKRLDVKARINANIGNVINIDNNFDVYPGLNLGLKNFGTHLGARYFFSDGFGVFSEINIPLAKYKTDDLSYTDKIHNQFSINAGLVFNL
ncbi:DUF6646 family protein [Lacinutrix iliipiscaria]|uniref:DUF6646 family protein n=1 Tax=Lacinutrix iliipiscaria TaxID=1230532 RepID=A0ABW5WKB5_9FLAO